MAEQVAADEVRSWSWGRLPELSVVVAIGLALVALANIAGTQSQPWAEAAFYGGLLLMVIPVALRLVSVAPEGTERVSLVALLAVGLFLAKTVHDPVTFGAYDEFLHWRTAQDLISSGTLFTPNSLLSVSPYYAGLELVSTAIANMAGIPVFVAGTIVLAVARLVFLVSLFFFFAMLSGSTRVAGIAALVYMANPKFLYFNAQYSYELLALPLAALVLYLLARRAHSAPARWLGLSIVALVTLPAVVVTHHVTSLTLVAFLILWAIVGVALRRRDRAHPGRIALLTAFLISGWILFVASATIGYLGPALASTLSELIRLVAGHVDPRELFTTPTGIVPPLWERAVGSVSALLVVVLLPLGLFVVWSRYRTNPAVVAMAIASLAYPATLVARYTQVGAEVAGRTPEFLFIAIGLVIALALARLSFRGRIGALQASGVAVVVGVLFVGGVIVGLPGWARLPGPYLVSADGRSVESEGISAALWARVELGPGRVMVADRVNRILMATYGEQSLVTTYETRLPVRRLYLATEIGPAQRQIVRESGTEFLVIDRRLATGPPTVGHYFDRGEGRITGGADKVIDPSILAKFDHQTDVSRVFDSGNIQLYDVRALGSTT